MKTVIHFASVGMIISIFVDIIFILLRNYQPTEQISNNIYQNRIIFTSFCKQVNKRKYTIFFDLILNIHLFFHLYLAFSI